MNVCGVVRVAPPGCDGRARVERSEFAAFRVEAKRGHRGIELIGHEYQGQPWVENDVARARAGPHDRVATLYMAERLALEVQTVHEHAVHAQVRGEHEAVGRIGDDAVRMRCLLPSSVRSRALVLLDVGG